MKYIPAQRITVEPEQLTITAWTVWANNQALRVETIGPLHAKGSTEKYKLGLAVTDTLSNGRTERALYTAELTLVRTPSSGRLQYEEIKILGKEILMDRLPPVTQSSAKPQAVPADFHRTSSPTATDKPDPVEGQPDSFDISISNGGANVLLTISDSESHEAQILFDRESWKKFGQVVREIAEGQRKHGIVQLSENVALDVYQKIGNRVELMPYRSGDGYGSKVAAGPVDRLIQSIRKFDHETEISLPSDQYQSVTSPRS